MIKEVSFAFPLRVSERPLSGSVANAALFGELVPGGGALVYGCYDLVVCYSSSWAEVLPCAFAIQVQLSSGTRRGELRVSLCRPFEVAFRERRPQGKRLWELLQRLLWGRLRFEAVVAGEVAVEFIAAEEQRPAAACAGEGRPSGAAEEPPVREQRQAARRRGDEVTIELEALADLVSHLLDRRGGGRSASREEGPRPLPEEAPPGGDSLDKLEEIVRRVVRACEEEKRGASGETGAVSSLPLEQIPSRPGLYRELAQSLPPPKPPPGPAPGGVAKQASWSDVCSLLRSIPLHPPSKPSGSQERVGREDG